jgi:serine/threonine protein kinase
MERPEKCVDLFGLVECNNGLLKEESCRRYFRQIVEATMACHHAGVLHNDLKEENILVDLQSDTVKLIDFGEGMLLKDEAYTDVTGTTEYNPPELITTGKYHGVSATVWSLGILLFSIACGNIPFHSADMICRGELHFPVGISPLLQDLIRSMLAVDPDTRPQLENILEHKWLKPSSDK